MEIDRAAIRSFSLLALIIGSGWLIFIAARPKADISDNLSATFSSSAASQTTHVDIQPNGEILIDEELTTETVQRTRESDEVRLKLIDNESDYLPRLDVTLHLPVPLRQDKTKPTYDILAVHGANRQRPIVIDEQTIRFVATDIEPEATVTVIAQMPRGALRLGVRATINSITTAVSPIYWWIGGIVIVLITYLSLIIRRSLTKVNRSALTTTPPSSLSPAAAGLLVNQRIGYEQLAATLVAMACRGDIQIVQTRTGYRIARKRELVNLTAAERFLIDELRLQIGPIGHQAVIESELRKKLFSQKITNAYLSTFAELETRGFFASDASKKRVAVRFRGLLLIIISVVAAISTALTIPSGTLLLPTWIGLFLAGWIILIKASQIPLLTSVGQQEHARWIGFINFLQERKPMPGGQDNAKLFTSYLPFAITFNVLAEWIGRFNNDFLSIPEWYFNEENPGSTELFIADIAQITTEVAQTLTNSALPQT